MTTATNLAAVRRPEPPASQRAPLALVDLKAAEWARLEPLLPPHRPRTGCPWNDHRAVVGGIPWVLRNGASWRDMPARFGNDNAAYKPCRLWSDTGLWGRIHKALRSATDDDHDSAEVLL